nr:hypothetical protein [Tanacetum cinerariifolium]
MVPPNKLGPDLSGKAVNETQYTSMIGSLMYLTTSKPDIQFSTCLYARYQVNPKESHLVVVKKIFRKSTSGACQLLGGKLVCRSAKNQQYVAMSSAEAEYVAAAGCCANILWMKSQLTNYDIVYEKVAVTDGSNHLVFRWETGGLDQISNKDVIILYCLANGVHVDYAKLIWEDIIHKLSKKTKEKIVPYHSQSETKTKSSLAKDKSPSYHLPLTLVVGEMHKETQQVVGSPTSLGSTIKEGAHPQLSNDSTVEADPGLSAPNDSISP